MLENKAVQSDIYFFEAIWTSKGLVHEGAKSTLL